MTERYVGKYLDDRNFYHIQTGSVIDNPDQRIVDDIAGFTGTSLALAFTVLNAGIDLVSFSGILFGIYKVRPWNIRRMHLVQYANDVCLPCIPYDGGVHGMCNIITKQVKLLPISINIDRFESTDKNQHPTDIYRYRPISTNIGRSWSIQNDQCRSILTTASLVLS